MSSLKFLTVLSLGLLAIFGESHAKSCMASLKNAAEFQKVGETCMKKLVASGVDSATLLGLKDIEKNHFDDKCLSNCTLEAMKFQLKDGTLQTDGIIKMLKANAPEEAQEKLIEAVKECVEMAYKHEHHHDKDHKMSKSAKHISSTISPKQLQQFKEKLHCKHAAKFLHCFKQKEEKIC